jgi:hypothetical protein
MKSFLLKCLIILFVTTITGVNSNANTNIKIQDEMKSDKNQELAIVWTSADRDVALKMVFMYAFNAKKMNWWNDINFIVWGPSSKLLSEDKELQEYIVKMKKVGVKVYACKACADMYGVSDKLSKLGLEVKYMGVDLTNFIKTDCKVITF